MIPLGGRQPASPVDGAISKLHP
ncbi:hypothetical protein AZE42_12131 [Rhizopogon vesiculosus]|uniref:Uncharacterized protein n=1 Tax=Rhizopogon vesiculosus TaxID=180088 RepID=A0A1J8PQ77_9AGAM|nr:hypothetical protein AZE42_12131 [Rhizopogon vesiculosus]